MEPMTAKEFLALELRDFENGAIITSIVVALQERENLILQSNRTVTREEIVGLGKRIADMVFNTNMDMGIICVEIERFLTKHEIEVGK